ncbi:GGDEF domain-containing protein [Microvirga sp. GCM10011540]|uniref:GGDEF domain-containing protein n=1 Tax=Microvirga sp. GCM10011540 TaxID=3317338 RepID=UPI0036220CC5
MNLDPPTLGFVFVLTTAVLGILLLFAWLINRTITALAWWGSAFVLVFCGMALVSLDQSPPGMRVLLVANGFMALAYGALYSGCRVFNGRSGAFQSLVVGLVVWLVAFLAILDNAGARLLVMSLIAGTYAGLSAWELWRHGPHRLTSQLTAVFLLVGLTVFNAFRGVLGVSATSVFWIDVFAKRWSSEMALILVVYMPALAFIFLSMAKERMEIAYKHAALVDPLTGIPNRRAFFDRASGLIRAAGQKPVSCLLFDLDRFKGLNDHHGHDIGDQTLRIFSRTLSEKVPGKAFGRLGGDEFAAVLPLDRNEARAVAEDIRQSFASAAEAVLRLPIQATVSVGCATANASTVEHLLGEADEALYRAKSDGRNAVAAIGGKPPRSGSTRRRDWAAS